jgi:hypothetical protein
MNTRYILGYHHRKFRILLVGRFLFVEIFKKYIKLDSIPFNGASTEIDFMLFNLILQKIFQINRAHVQKTTRCFIRN